MLDILSKDLVLNSQKANPWDLGNQVLYDLCSDNFTHKTDKEVIAKTWMIGRSYAASIERTKREETNEVLSDDFYLNKVVRIFKDSELYKKISTIRNMELNLGNKNKF